MDDIKTIINDTVNSTVLKMKMAGLLKDNRKTAMEKLEELLRNYPIFKEITDQEYTVKLVGKVNKALEKISDDPYYDVIKLFYFENKSREFIALEYGCTETTISRNKTRLLNEIKPMLFSDDVIYELFL
jgi:RNA polymerase sigma factor (sigma-70 family)